jgi:hypothetical protein
MNIMNTADDAYSVNTVVLQFSYAVDCLVVYFTTIFSVNRLYSVGDWLISG